MIEAAEGTRTKSAATAAAAMTAAAQAEARLQPSEAKVRFTPGARSNWHSHALGQTLHVTEGVGLVRKRGGEIIEIRSGDTIYTPPGEEHWHGATPEDCMEQLAMWVWDNGDDPPTSTGWLEPVTDVEYRRP